MGSGTRLNREFLAVDRHWSVVLSETFNGNTIGVSRAGVGTDCQDRYVQDERYVAGAGMRRSDFFQVGIVFMDVATESPGRGSRRVLK